MLKSKVSKYRIYWLVAFSLFILGAFLQVHANELEDFRVKYDRCNPISISQPFRDDPYSANFIWFADADQCDDDVLSWITNVVHNHSEADLIFKWPKAGVWADKFTPLPKGYSRGEPVGVLSVETKPDTDAPIFFTQSYRPHTPAVVYVPARNGASYQSNETRTKLARAGLTTTIRTAAKTKDGIVEVEVDFTSYSKGEAIYTEIRASPGNVTIAINQIPDYFERLDNTTQEQTFKALEGFLKKHDARFEISSLRNLIGKDHVEYVPQSLIDSRFLAISSENWETPLRFEFPVSNGANNSFNSERFDIQLANIVVLGKGGTVLGNGRVSVLLPERRE